MDTTTQEQSTSQIIRPRDNVLLRVATHFGQSGTVYDRGPVLNSGQSWTVQVTAPYGETVYVENVPESAMVKVAEPDTRSEQIVELTRQRDTLEQQRREARQEASRAVSELSDFKEQVAEVATRYGVEHDMCGVLDECLAELGLERVNGSYRVQCSLTYWVEVAANTDDEAREQARYVFDGLSLSGDSLEDSESMGREDVHIDSVERS